MTREEILALEGNDLNKTVAIEVMGFEEISNIEDAKRKQISSYLPGHGIFTLYGDRYVARFGGKSIIWNPNESISAAWEVVEKLKDNLQIFTYFDGSDPAFPKGWSVKINGVHVEGCDTAPEAICKCALLAMKGSE